MGRREGDFLADFGCDPCSSDSLRGSRNFVFFGEVNKALFFHGFFFG